MEDLQAKEQEVLRVVAAEIEKRYGGRFKVRRSRDSLVVTFNTGAERRRVISRVNSGDGTAAREEENAS